MTATWARLAPPDPAGRPRVPVRYRPVPARDRLEGTWRQARPARIAAALALAQLKNAGGWYVVGASDEVPADRSVRRHVAGQELVLWRGTSGELRAASGTCPHLGASLGGCEVMHGQVYCRWHGLALGDQTAGWVHYPVHDDGVLVWARVPTDGESPTAQPVLPGRPPVATSISAVISLAGRCDAADIIANRLDPWHGAWFHPYAFSHLEVDEGESDHERLVLDVTFRLSRRWGVPVRAEFACPDSRTIVMTITEGEGAGSVVETHATPLGVDQAGLPVTVMTEATIASSDRVGFRVARRGAALLRPLMAVTARRLWVDDMAYAERRWLVRAQETAARAQETAARASSAASA